MRSIALSIPKELQLDLIAIRILGKKYHLIGLLLLQLAISFCGQENKKNRINSIKEQTPTIKKETKSCCTSRTPARFSIKNAVVKAPGKGY